MLHWVHLVSFNDDKNRITWLSLLVGEESPISEEDGKEEEEDGKKVEEDEEEEKVEEGEDGRPRCRQRKVNETERKRESKGWTTPWRRDVDDKEEHEGEEEEANEEEGLLQGMMIC